MLLTVRIPQGPLGQGRSQARSCRARRASVRCLAAQAPEFTGRQFTLLSTSEAATQHLAEVLAMELRPGDAYCLKGDEHAGKTEFSRAFIRTAAQSPDLAVPTPTPSITPYEYSSYAGMPVLHLDLNNLQQPSAADCEQLASAFPDAVSLIEWAEQLKDWGAAPEQRLALYFRMLPAGALGMPEGGESSVRLVTVVPHTASWELRAGLLHASLAVGGSAAGLFVLSDDLASTLTAGLPESLTPALANS